MKEVLNGALFSHLSADQLMWQKRVQRHSNAPQKCQLLTNAHTDLSEAFAKCLQY